MKLHEHYGTLAAAGLARAIFILDASESAAAVQAEILALGRDALAMLPAGVERSLHFLGDPEPYPAGELAVRGSQWASANRQRASLVAPIFERLPPGERATVVIIGAGRIFDLEDWRGTPVLERTVLVTFGESLRGVQDLAEELVRPSRAELARRIHDPVIRAAISGPAFMPTAWNNPAWRLATDRHQISLVCENAEDYALRLRYFSSTADPAAVTFRHAGGSETSGVLAEADETAPRETAAGRLPPEEVALFRAALAHGSFDCPCCRGRHNWETLRCLKGAMILGELVYPSLQRANAAGFVLFHLAGEDVSFTVHPCPVLRVASGRVAVKSGGKAEIHCFDEATGHWRATGERLRPYDRIGADAYAVFL